MEEHHEIHEESVAGNASGRDLLHRHEDAMLSGCTEDAVHRHGDEAEPEHSHSHPHPHTHHHTQTKAVLGRLARAIGHLEAVKKMVENGRDCTEVLVQLAAVRAALGSTSKLILKDHMEHCIADAVRDQDAAAIEELEKAIDQLLV